MPTKTRGRPRTNTNNVNIDEILVEFLSEKETEYGDICYFKIVDNEWRKKLKPITSLEEDDLKMPYWLTDDENIILKVKSKYCMDNYEPQKMYFIDIMFTSYSMENPPIKGYFSKILSMKSSEFKIEINNNN